MRHFVLGIALFFSLSGCSQLDKISDDDLQQGLSIGARHAVSYGLKLAFKKFPAEAKKIAADADIAYTILTKNLIPAFDGSTTADVTRSVLDTAFTLLKDKVKDARVLEVADIAVEFILANVKLPAKPTDKLDERTQKVLLGIFTGMADGIKKALPAAAAPEPPRATLTLPQNP